jgi:hypothetical protein
MSTCPWCNQTLEEDDCGTVGIVCIKCQRIYHHDCMWGDYTEGVGFTCDECLGLETEPLAREEDAEKYQ